VSESSRDGMTSPRFGWSDPPIPQPVPHMGKTDIIQEHNE
jgi:hypothetical protein